MTTAAVNMRTAYTTVICGPKMTSIIAIITGLRRGDANRKDMALEKATPDFRNPSVTGIVEQEQNGVIAPKAAPITLPLTEPECPRTFCIFSLGT